MVFYRATFTAFRSDHTYAWWEHPEYSEAEIIAVGDLDNDGVLSDADERAVQFTVSRGIIRYVPTILWIEGIATSIGNDLDTITVYADPDGNGNQSDGVFVTVYAVDCPWSLSVAAGQDCGNSPWIQGTCSGENRIWYGVETAPQLNLNLVWGPDAPDLPPLETDIVASSSPLVSKEAVQAAGPSPFAKRAVHEGVVDLATGTPLIQNTDFELPFGSAVFRHTRTYAPSATAYDCGKNFIQELDVGNHSKGAWDWNGDHWMMSENPLLLVDAQYWWNCSQTQPMKMCYLLLDAHHTVPFMLDTSGHYVAPKWFDAVMTHNGVMGTGGEWSTRPTEFKVWLYRQSVKYIFDVHYEDVTDAQHNVSECGHQVQEPLASPIWPRTGVPHYGLVRSIADRYGNAMVYNYCGGTQTNCDDPTTPKCAECCHSCNQKGQIKTIKLVTAYHTEAQKTVWTLVYTHRAFAGNVWWNYAHFPEPGSPENHPFRAPASTLSEQHQVHTIQIFDRDVADSELPDCATISLYDFCGLSNLAEFDSLNLPNIPTDWVIEARYLYGEAGTLMNPAFANNYACAIQCNYIQPDGDEGPGTLAKQLLKATITRRTKKSAHADLVQHWLYRYGVVDWGSECIYYVQPTGQYALKYVFSPSTVDSILRGTTEDPRYLQMGANAILGLGLHDPVKHKVQTDTGSEIRQSELVKLADIALSEENGTWDRGCGDNDYPEETMSPLFNAMAAAISATADRTVPIYDGITSLTNRDGTFVYYRFREFPEVPYNNFPQSPGGYRWNRRCINEPQERVPYRYQKADGTWANIIGSGHEQERFYITIVDELDPKLGTYNAINREGIRSRRIVELNAAGFVISDRTWTWGRGADGELFDQTGFSEHSDYDSDGRLLIKHTRGWDVANGLGIGASEGLLYLYAYDDDGAHPTRELKSISIKRGTGTAHSAQPLESYTRGLLDGTGALILDHDGKVARPELLTSVTKYDDSGQPESVTAYEYMLYAPSDFPPEWELDDSECPMKSKIVKKPGAPLTASQPTALYRPVEQTQYNTSGLEQWTGLGLLKPDGVNYEYFFVNYNEFDDLGRPKLAALDTGTHALSGEFERVVPDAATNPPLNYETQYTYEDPYGLKSIRYPSGREDRVAYVYNSIDATLEQWTFKDLVATEDPNTHERSYRAASPGLINILAGSTLEKALQVTFDQIVGEPDGQNDTFTVVSEKKPDYDQQGRITGLSDSAGGLKISASMDYDGMGNIARQRSADGTITRSVYDELGRLQKTYRGTADQHVVWGTGLPVCQIGQATDCVADPNTYNDNMVLLEKRYYGSNVTNAGRLDYTRRFQDQPAEEYVYWNPQLDEGNGGYTQSQEDVGGWITEYHYDWRMREVWTKSFDAAGQIMSQTVTWYDNANRPRYVADFGPQITSNVTLSGYGDLAPILDQVVAKLLVDEQDVAKRPISLIEHIYNARGQEQETRVWTPASGGTAHYTNTFNCYDQADHVVETLSSGDGVHRYEYDAKGRQIWSRTFADDLEVEKTQTKFNSIDQAVESVHWERKAGTTGTLDSQAVQTWRLNWYDAAGKMTATADYGTNHNDNVFATGTAPQRSDDLLQTDTSHALVHQYEYDSVGNQRVVHNPDGTVTQSEYDALGRLILSTEDAAGLARQTAYLYECANNPLAGCSGNRLIAMAAVLPGHHGGNVTKWSDIDWQATDGSLQVTQFDYDAVVVDSSGPISANNAWISAVHYPDPDPNAGNGQPKTVADITFTYYADGSVASRSDAKGNVFGYQYDELGRIKRVQVTTSWSAYASGIPTYDLPPTIDHLVYSYTPSGKPFKLTAYADSSDNNPVSESQFWYDDHQNLIAEAQAHGAHVQTSTPTIHYFWDYVAAGTGSAGYQRVSSIEYPVRPENTGIAGRVLNYGYGSGADAAFNRVISIAEQNGPTWASYAYSGTGRRISTTFGNGVTQTFAGTSGYEGMDRFGQIQDLWFKHANVSTPPDHTLFRHQYAYDAAGNRRSVKFTKGGTYTGNRSYFYNYDGLERLIEAQKTPQLDANGVPQYSAFAGGYTMWNMDNLGNWSAGDDDFGGRVVLNSSFSVTSEVRHEVAADNRINNIVTDGVSQAIVSDVNGNMVFDGERVYQYDAWNRQIAVNEAGSLIATDFNTSGQIAPAQGHVIGSLVCQMVYDGMGRLIEVRRPHSSTTPPRPLMDIEAYYYDSLRRIQTITATETAIGTLGTLHTEREYVYGSEYIDEFVAQVDDPAATTPTIMYMLQDANYNVSAILSDAQSGQTPTVLAEYTYDPYGQPVYASEPGLSAGTYNTVGHQGLFFYAFSTSGSPMATTTNGLYFNRNRWYSPKLGRFTSRDPNETAMPIIGALIMSAESAMTLINSFGPGNHFINGMNLYGYEGSNPLRGIDPLGLSDPFAEVDNWLSDRTGNAMYTLGMLNEGATLGLKVAVDIAASFLPGYGLYQAFKSVQVIASGKGGFWDAMNIAFVALPVLKTVGGLLLKDSVALRSFGKAAGFLERECGNSFVAGTLIDTPDGQKPIESLAVGDVVGTRDAKNAEGPPSEGRITAVIRGRDIETLWIMLANGRRMGITPKHILWTYQDGWTTASELHIGNAVQDIDGQPVEVIGIEIDHTPRLVYNLEVNGTFTYFAEGIWVHNSKRCESILTSLGWVGQKAWKDAVRLVKGGGEYRTIGGKVLTYNEAELLLQEAGCVINRVDEAHDAASVASRINYIHINFTAPNGLKGHLGIQALP